MPKASCRVRSLVSVLLLVAAPVPAFTQEGGTAKAEHAQIGVGTESVAGDRTRHPDAQWFPDAGLGLFIHWGLSSVRAMNISWPMIPGRALAAKRIESAEERERIVRERDYNLDGKGPAITPNDYWSMAKDFDPKAYDPDKWLAAAREAGFTYAVLTTKHHEGFTMWPSAFGDFGARTHLDGRDLVRPFVEACRRHGLKVGFYFSGPDWYFDRDYMSFLYGRARQNNPELPSLGPDLLPRRSEKSAEEIAKHQAEYAALVKGQIEELLTRYGKVDVLWFDGRPAIPRGQDPISIERIRELQPGIVINPRLHGHGDYVTAERTLAEKDRPERGTWAEYCNTWTRSWAHEALPFRAPGFVLGQLAHARSWGFNYLLGVGPMASGEMTPAVYDNMAVVRDWMKANGASVVGARPLPEGESASVYATASGDVRYLFAVPRFKDGYGYVEDQLPAEDVTLTLTGAGQPRSVTLLATGKPVEFRYADGVLSVPLPAARRTPLVDVVAVALARD